MAHKKGMGSTRNGRDSESKRLGVKRGDGEFVRSGTIIVRQRGTQFWLGNNVGIGKDHTVYSMIDGVVRFETISRRAIELFSDRIGPYSYEKLANVTAPFDRGATEHASVIFYGDGGTRSGAMPQPAAPPTSARRESGP